MLNERPIPRELRERVEREISHDESIVWMDMPAPHFFSSFSSVFFFLFAIPWTAVAAFWIAMAAYGTSKIDAPAFVWFFPLFGLPFLGIGFWMLSAPIRMYRKWQRTVYVITNLRAIVLDCGRSLSVKSFEPDQLRSIQRNEKTDGTGSIVFTQNVETNLFFPKNPLSMDNERPGFMRIRDVKSVEGLLRNLTAKIAATK